MVWWLWQHAWSGVQPSSFALSTSSTTMRSPDTVTWNLSE